MTNWIFRAKGAASIKAWGNAPGLLSPPSKSAESAIRCVLHSKVAVRGRTGIYRRFGQTNVAQLFKLRINKGGKLKTCPTINLCGM